MLTLEATLYDASRLFLVPVILLILASLGYSLLSLGRFALGIERVKFEIQSLLGRFACVNRAANDSPILFWFFTIHLDSVTETKVIPHASKVLMMWARSEGDRLNRSTW